MTQPIYVIRGYYFGYNDEYYYVCGSRINSIYHDKQQAEQAYKALQVRHIKDVDLGEEEGFIESKDADLFDIPC